MALIAGAEKAKRRLADNDPADHGYHRAFSLDTVVGGRCGGVGAIGNPQSGNGDGGSREGGVYEEKKEVARFCESGCQRGRGI